MQSGKINSSVRRHAAAPLCAAYVINLGSSAQAAALRSQTIARVSPRSQIQFAAARVRTSGKDAGTEGNVIMQGHAGAMFSITAALILIKKAPTSENHRLQNL